MENGDRVIVHTDLNDGRYEGRRGTIVVTDDPAMGRVKFVVQLDHWTPGWESPDGRLYLFPDEVEVEA